MKHPALTRILCVVLTVLCLTMLAAGAGSAAAAYREKNKAQADADRLSDRIEAYRQIRDGLEGAEDYQEASLALQEKQEEHDEKAGRHRMDLAVFTATKGGVRTGKATLSQAESAFWSGKAQYEEGLALFQQQEAAFWEAYAQFQAGKQQLEEGKKILALAEAAVASVRAQINNGRSMAAILDSDDEDARLELSLAAYDDLLQAIDGAMQFYDLLQAQGGISPGQMEQISALLAEEADPALAEQLSGIAWEGISAESLQEIESGIIGATGMTPAQIRAQVQQQRDQIAGMDRDAPISAAEYAMIQASYFQYRLLLEAMDTAIEAKLGEIESKLQETRAQLDAAQEQIDQIEPMMEEGKAAIEEGKAALEQAGEQIAAGEAALAEGRRQLEEKEKELTEQEEKLRKEKAELDKEAVALQEKHAALDRQQELEKQETSVRLMLLERDGIQDLVDKGMELVPASESFAGELRLQHSEKFRTRLVICAAMILGALSGILEIPAAFEKTNSRFRLIAPVLFCLGFAAVAEALCRVNGRGDSYSALAVCVFALIQLALVLPKKKKN